MSIINTQRKFEKEIEKEAKRYLRSEKRKTITKDVVIPNDYQLFNKMIGYPTSKILNKPQPMTLYQILYHNIINNRHRVILNKSRKIRFYMRRCRC